MGGTHDPLVLPFFEMLLKPLRILAYVYQFIIKTFIPKDTDKKQNGRDALGKTGMEQGAVCSLQTLREMTSMLLYLLNHQEALQTIFFFTSLVYFRVTSQCRQDW